MMVQPSLFPLFMNPLDQIIAAAAGGDGLVIELIDEPDITLDPDITIALEADGIDISVEPEIEIEVE